MDIPRVSIVVCTYDREKEIIQTLEHLSAHLDYPLARLSCFICDDASPNHYVERLKKHPVIKYFNPEFVVQPTNGGWGKNVTAGLVRAYRDSPYVFFLEDDYVLQEPLDLLEGVALIESTPKIGMVRYRGTAGTELKYTQYESDIKAIYPEYLQQHGYVPGKLTYLDIDHNSHSLYIYSNGPHLKHQRFHEWFGYYPSGWALGSTEEMYAHIVKDRMIGDYPRITILPEWIPMRWKHIGTSYQLGEKDTLPSLRKDAPK